MLMSALLVGAFGYAVWLVLTRRIPDAASWKEKGRRGIFIFLTLYFMHCLGAPVLAAESGESTGSTSAVVPANETVAFYDAVVAAWVALGYMGRGDMLAQVGPPVVLQKYRDAQARKDDDAMLQLRRSHSDDVRGKYREDFGKLMVAAADSGRISRNAAFLLAKLYNRLSYHFHRMQTTCYMSVPLKREPKTKDSLFDIEKSIRALAGGGTPDRKAKYELTLALERLLEHEIELEDIWALKHKDDGDYERYENALRKVEDLKAQRCGQDELLQAAEILIRIGPRLPKDWGEMNSKYD